MAKRSRAPVRGRVSAGRRSRVKWGAVSVAAAVVGALALAGLEASARRHVTDPLIYQDSLLPELGFEPIPRSGGLLEGAEVRLNSRGLRALEFPAARRPGVRRALILGDSVAFGRGVPVDKTFAALWEKSLGPGREVINAAVCAYSGEQELAFFEKRLADVELDALVLALTSDDFDPSPRPLVGRMAGVKNYLRSHSALARSLMEGTYRRRSGAPVSPGLAHAAEPPAPSTDEIPPAVRSRADALMARARRAAEERGCRLAVLFIPRLDRFHLNAADAARREAARAAASAQGVSFWDATGRLTQGNPLARLLRPHQGFLNESGHAEVARELAERAAKERLLG